MVKLSVNVNKIATVRNSRGGRVPSVLEAVRTCVAAGAPGITVHPRADARHITAADVREIARRAGAAARPRGVQHRGRPAARLRRAGGGGAAGPVHAGAGARRARSPARPAGRPTPGPPRWRRRSSGAATPAFASACSWMPTTSRFDGRAATGAQRVELYTEPFARAFEAGPAAAPCVVRPLCPRRQPGRVAGAGGQRRPRPGPRQPGPLPRPAAPGRSVDRPRAGQPRPLRRASSAASATTWPSSPASSSPAANRPAERGAIRHCASEAEPA